MNYDTKIESIPEEDALAASELLSGDDDQDRIMRRRIWVAAAIALVLMVGIWALTHLRGGSDLTDESDIQTPVVTVVVPGKTTVQGEISATGTLAARREMPVGSVGEGGEIRQVLVEPGDWVERGQVLAIVDRSVQSQQIASQTAQVDVARADAQLAQSNLERALKLVDRGFISKADVDRLTAERNAANARVRVAQATLGQLKAQAARLNIVAPAAGLVLERNAEPGQVVGGGTGVLFRLAKAGEMELLADLSEDDLAKLSVGVTAQVIPVGSNKTFTGQVWQISPVIDPDNRQGTARIALSYAKELRPGGFASATIETGAVVAPMLPESAIQNDEKGAFVYVVGKDDRVQHRDVKTGLVTADGIAIKSGLNGTEKVVLRAGGFLNNGDKVQTKLVTEKN
ncbi:efflux RND transporter periplasmic adaptor subunit [Novosphingobium pentaromativorans]|uniref:Secretion protein HlyD n=1 Tax=Novosphingobium pentaromativorans US6-1 TaxID=1088721 RepID=G6EBM3_9SPHN|nr:efflux RND transporter periplasmic adaptor subunit [Novosphingobium pentaromativorans]AIT80331.1 secretion protein HylD [Novosphingobium pentaromativorans US6-1]EHJ61305.1 secretion protein HlyD [Novosphingobium pentaromativorans US6-1]